jgi:UDP-N-acetyl-D-galactosamine dehydrogenase
MKHKICIVGLGYVGLPLYIEFAKKFNVLGYDKNINRIKNLRKGYDSNNEHNEDLTKTALNFYDDINKISNCNTYIVTVPTPINADKTPDLTFLESVFLDLGQIIKKDDLVILESTVFPGCSEEVCIPILEKKSGLKLNIDFYFGYSPERINPGDKVNILSSIKKVTSGSNKYSSKIVKSLYKEIIKAGVHSVSSLKIAEASKILENTQRDLNISLMNEFAFICDKLNICTNEVIEAASTKWNFQKFSPGLVGGHCIGVDPYYLTHKAIQVGYKPDIILSGRKVNEAVAPFIIDKIVKKTLSQGKVISNSKILILGATFKENCGDFRNSKVLDMYQGFKEYFFTVDLFDPLVDKEAYFNENRVKISNNLTLYDAIIIAVPHKEFLSINFKKLMKDNETIIFDVKGVFKNPKYLQL